MEPNLQRLLKQWRRIGSPTYEAAFELGSLCALSTNNQCLLRARAGEEGHFDLSTSWLHKKKQRLEHFLMGRPIPAASPDISQGSRKFLKAEAKWYRGNQNVRLHYRYRNYRAKEPFANIKTTYKRRSYWRGKHAIARGMRRLWWSARRVLKTEYLAATAAGPPFNRSGLKWAVEEGLLETGVQVLLADGVVQLCQPRWSFLTPARDVLYFESLDDRKSLKMKRLQSAKVSINNAFGRTEYVIDREEYVQDWNSDMTRNGVIFSPLYVGKGSASSCNSCASTVRGQQEPLGWAPLQLGWIGLNSAGLGLDRRNDFGNGWAGRLVGCWAGAGLN